MLEELGEDRRVLGCCPCRMAPEPHLLGVLPVLPPELVAAAAAEEPAAAVVAAASLAAAVVEVGLAAVDHNPLPPSLVVAVAASVAGLERWSRPPLSTCSSPRKDPP